MKRTYYIWLRATDSTGEYDFFDEVNGTPEELIEALRSWNNDPNVEVIGVN